jgi:putative DNA primase/helicase
MSINLVTGERYEARREDYMTKMAAVAPDDDMPIPLWLACLARVTNGDADLQAYLQRVIGYCLTGHTNEHVIFFLWGTGANGKSVFTSTIAGMMGDYALTAPMDTFIESKLDRHPTELAMLRGARLVTATETTAGRHWNESRLKALTGGDKIAARYMRGDFFEFTPTFKLMISGNHRPALRNIDEAIRRRLHLIPFTVTIPPDERDLNLSDKLKAEWPGILAWAVEGTLEWRRIGLSPPAAVVNATADYLAAEDDTQSWLEECCIEQPDTEATSSELYGSWKAWADRSGRIGGAGSQKALSQALQDRGISKERRRTGTAFLGLKVIRQNTDWQPQ